MKNNIYIFLFLFLAAASFSCRKKDYPAPPSSTSPVFSFIGTIGGSPVTIQAGVNNYYMSTAYAQDGNGVYDFTGEFKNSNCTSNCPNSLKIYLKDYRQYSVQPTAIDSSIVPGYYSFATPAGAASKFYVQFFDSLYIGTAQSRSWDFGDGLTSAAHKPIHVYAHPGVYKVSLNVQSTTSCSSSLINDVMVGQVGGLVQLSFGGNSAGNTVNLASTTGGGTGPGTYTFNWDFGDTHTATTTSPTYTYTYGSSGVYPITLTRTDAVNTVEVCRRNFATQNATSCYMNFYPTNIINASNPMNLADVTLEWHDAGGMLWTSANNSQTVKSMFKVTSVENYHNNLSGQPTKKIHAQITCTLYNGTNSMILNGEAVFSAAHL